MARRERRQTQLAGPDTPVIPPITDAPGAEADATVLAAHYRRVQNAFACHNYDDCMAVCRWCLDEAPLPFPEPHQRGTRKYCSRRCADAYAAYKAKYYRRAKVSVSDTEPLDDDDEKDFPSEPSESLAPVDTTDEGMQTG